MRMLYSLFWTCCFYVIGLPIGFILAMLAYPLVFFSESRRFDNRFFFLLTGWWSRFLVWTAGIKYQVTGFENIPTYPKSPAIFAVNHSSAFDIPVVEMLLKGYPHVWISKQVYGRLPVMGTILNRMHLLLNRGALENAVLVLKKAHKRAKGHVRHLVMFPEGSRFTDGKVHDFFQGFALLAKSLQRPVVPIAIYGLHKIYARGSLLVDSSACEVKISIGKPMCISKNETREQFSARVHAWFTQEMTKLSSR